MESTIGKLSRQQKSKTIDQKPESNSQNYKPGSITEHLLYGLITLIIMTGPPLISEISLSEWMLMICGGVIFIYTIICLFAIKENILSYFYPKRQRRR